jgi:hypothetical protein
MTRYLLDTNVGDFKSYDITAVSPDEIADNQP